MNGCFPPPLLFCLSPCKEAQVFCILNRWRCVQRFPFKKITAVVSEKKKTDVTETSRVCISVCVLVLVRAEAIAALT